MHLKFTNNHARLHVLLSTDSPSAVIIRRGPRKVVCSLLWNRDTDEIILGQWLKGQINWQWADISPDGLHWIYPASKYGKHDYHWTAIAKTPWLKALQLNERMPYFDGGGIFLSNNHFWLEASEQHPCSTFEFDTPVRMPELSVKPIFANQQFPTFPHRIMFYHHRLLKNGWEFIQHQYSKKGDFWHYSKPFNSQWALTLQVECHSSPYRNHYQLTNLRNNASIELPGWEWAEVDNESLVYTQNGCLFRLISTELATQTSGKLIFNFNRMTFEERKAPY